MNKPLRLRFLEALTTCLKGITVANGYQFDLATSVFRGRTIFGYNEALPMISIIEHPRNVEVPPSPAPKGGVASLSEWKLLIQGFIKDDKDNPTDPAHYLMADAKKALVIARKSLQASPATFLGFGGIGDVVIEQGLVRPPDKDISPTAYFFLPVTVTLAEDLEDPFSE